MENSVHMIGNMLIRIEGTTAAAESYFWSVCVFPGEQPQQVLTSGRYIDRFEKRDDEWRIAERTVVHDWFNQNAEIGDWGQGPFGMSGLLRGTTGREDPSYRLNGLP
jgi:hypothetical protein